MKRRNFLGKAVVGVPALMVAGHNVFGVAGDTTHSDDRDDWSEERKRLVAEANFGRKKGASSATGMAISSSPLVSAQAVKIMKQGGNAADAALASFDLTGYARRRNEVLPPSRRGASGLSPWIRNGARGVLLARWFWRPSPNQDPRGSETWKQYLGRSTKRRTRCSVGWGLRRRLFASSSNRWRSRVY